MSLNKIRLVLDKDGVPKIHKRSCKKGIGLILIEARLPGATGRHLSRVFGFPKEVRDHLYTFSDKYFSRGIGRCDGFAMVGRKSGGDSCEGACITIKFSVPMLFTDW